MSIPYESQRTVESQQFMVYDSRMTEPDLSWIVVWRSQFGHQLLQRTSLVAYDATYAKAPRGFYQYFTLHAYIDERLLPVAFVWMTNKDELTYTRVFQEIFSLPAENYNVKMYLSDFEQAPSNVMSTIFPYAEPIKCVFHLSQSNRKWAHKHGMANFYKNEHLMDWIVLFSKLAYLPKRDVIHGYLALVEAFASLVSERIPTLLDQSHAAAFMDYFRKTYLFRGSGAQLQPAVFPVHVWNLNKPVKSQLPVTNNAVESWNREYKAYFAGGGKPDRSKVIQFQVEEEEAVRHAIERHEDNPEESFRLVRPNQRRSIKWFMH